MERNLLTGNRSILGIDEVGRGCLAGPVFSACVSLNYNKLYSLHEKERRIIRDSKTLSKKQRDKAEISIKQLALEWSIGEASVHEIDELGIVDATFLSIKRALKQWQSKTDILLFDGNKPLPWYQGSQRAIVKGDALCFAIAAASILAKVARDAYMAKQALLYPHYDFAANVGYGTKNHMDNLKIRGPCPMHRRTFAPMKNMKEFYP